MVIVAGGLGLAPLRPAIYHLLRHRERYGRIAILYGARTPSEVLFGRELARWSKRGDVDVLLTVDRAEQDWHGDVGVVPPLIARAGFDPAATTPGLRPRGHDAFHRSGAARSRAWRDERITCRWSAT